jgi:hypothetical protein
VKQVIVTLKNATSTDLSAYAGYAVKAGTAGIALCTAITDLVIGIITRGGVTHSEVCILGECQALAGAAITQGTRIIPHTDGTLKATAASASECGFAMETGVAGDMVQVFVIPCMRPSAANS